MRFMMKERKFLFGNDNCAALNVSAEMESADLLEEEPGCGERTNQARGWAFSYTCFIRSMETWV